MSYVHFTPKERYSLMYLLQMGLSYREIGRRLNRSHATISREVKRNKRVMGCYWDEAADELAQARKKIPRHRYRQANKALVEYVEKKLRDDWSPETIAGRLIIDFPTSKRMRISLETIYQWVFNDAKKEGSLYLHLRRRRRSRRTRKPYGSGRGLFAGRVSIDQRPESVGNRRRFGHWESDSVLGRKGSGGVATHVERKSRYLVAAKLPDQGAKSFTEATNTAFSSIPKKWKKSLTVDNGKEFADFKSIMTSTGMKVYFCDPYSPWQRGTNENTNGLIRFYFPKGVDWQKVTHKQLAEVVEKLNNRPRKCLNYRTPKEVFLKSTGGALRT